MMKLVGVALSSERDKLMKQLTKLGCVEVTATTDRSSTVSLEENTSLDDVNIKLARLGFANTFIKEQLSYAKRVSKPIKHVIIVNKEEGDHDVANSEIEYKAIKSPLMDYKPSKKPFLAPKPELDFDEFMETDSRSKELFDKIAHLEELSAELVEVKAQEAKSLARIKSVYPYRQLTKQLNKYRDTRSAHVVLGGVTNKRLDDFLALNDTFQTATFVALHDMSKPNKNKYALIPVAVVSAKSEKEAVKASLIDVDFSEASFSQERDTVASIISSERAIVKLCQERRREVVQTIIDNYEQSQFTMSRRLAEDYYNIRLQMLRAEELMRATKSCYLFEAWVPSTCIEELERVVEPFNISYIIRDAGEDETPPTLLNDNQVVYPYQSVTNMFSVPAHNEINPNPFVTFFFVLFFGVMISDAVYGLIMTLGSGLILYKMKPRKNELSMVKILFMGGLSTIFWGILFGSYLGYTLVIGKVKYYLFNPIEYPMYMLILSLGLGLVQMLTGMAVNAYALFKQKKYADAIFGVFPWYVIILGIAMIFIPNSTVKYIAFGVVGLGLVGLMIGGSLHKKGFKKVSAGVSKLYSLVNFLSDLMSYTRLFGLGLATGVIAYVFNKLGTVFIDMIPVVGYVIAAAVMLLGHAFNIGINTLGAYVHNSRLQFVEFFGRFYTGGGHLFKPLGSNKKYYNFTLKEVKLND